MSFASARTCNHRRSRKGRRRRRRAAAGRPPARHQPRPARSPGTSSQSAINTRVAYIISSTRGRPTTNIGPSRHPGRPVRTGSSGNKVSTFRRVLDAVGTAKPPCNTHCDYGAQQGAPGPTSPRADPPLRPSTCSAARRDTGSAQRRCGFDELDFATLHEDGRDSVRWRRCVKKRSE